MRAMIAAESACTGRPETTSFHGLLRGMICIAATMASALAVLNSTGSLKRGSGPSARPA